MNEKEIKPTDTTTIRISYDTKAQFEDLKVHKRETADDELRRLILLQRKLNERKEMKNEVKK